MLPWETIEAKTRSEALEKSSWQEGDLGRCVAVDAIRTGKGAFALIPTFEKLERPEAPQTLGPFNGACGR
jgi:hypothetical protein